jgi:hypothetical protein
LADHLELANRRVLPHPFREERLAASARIHSYVIERVSDVF